MKQEFSHQELQTVLQDYSGLQHTTGLRGAFARLSRLFGKNADVSDASLSVEHDYDSLAMKLLKHLYANESQSIDDKKRYILMLCILLVDEPKKSLFSFLPGLGNAEIRTEQHYISVKTNNASLLGTPNLQDIAEKESRFMRKYSTEAHETSRTLSAVQPMMKKIQTNYQAAMQMLQEQQAQLTAQTGAPSSSTATEENGPGAAASEATPAAGAGAPQAPSSPGSVRSGYTTRSKLSQQTLRTNLSVSTRVYPWVNLCNGLPEAAGKRSQTYFGLRSEGGEIDSALAMRTFFQVFGPEIGALLIVLWGNTAIEQETKNQIGDILYTQLTDLYEAHKSPTSAITDLDASKIPVPDSLTPEWEKVKRMVTLEGVGDLSSQERLAAQMLFLASLKFADVVTPTVSEEQQKQFAQKGFSLYQEHEKKQKKSERERKRTARKTEENSSAAQHNSVIGVR